MIHRLMNSLYHSEDKMYKKSIVLEFDKELSVTKDYAKWSTGTFTFYNSKIVCRWIAPRDGESIR